MANFDRLRGVLADEEDPFLHGAEPMSEDQAPSIDHGDTSPARVAGLRQRPILTADWREKAAEDEARKRMMAERLTPSPEMMSKVVGSGLGVGQTLRKDFAQPVPVVRPVAVSGPNENPTPVPTTIPATTENRPAPKAGTSTDTVKPPAPPMLGSGGDDAELSDLRTRLGLQQAFEGLGSAASGKNLYTDGGILADRMKQIEALRAKKAERQEGLDVERSQNNQTLDMYKSLFPDKADSLEALRDLTGKGAVFKQGLDAWMKREELEKGKIPTAKARVGLLGAQKDAIPDKLEDVDAALAETKRHNLAIEAAAALAAQRAARGAAEDRGVRPEALTNRLKDLNAQTKPFQEIVSSLQEADAALSALGTGQISRGAKIASRIPLVGESLVSTPELRAMQGQEGLKQSYQKLKTGLAAVGQELASFERQFGTDWQADPRKAPMAIETLKQITQNALRRTQAPFGSGTGNPAIDQMEVLSLLKNTGGLTADNLIFQPNPKLAAAAGMASPPPPAAPSEGKVRMVSPNGRPAKIPVAEVEARKAQGWVEAQ
jgi:hypothetical protein